jgi:ubiquinone/menaquinone biosynthesis C-methylase UbiE
MTKLNVGCGGRSIPGYVGVDAVARPAAEVVSPAWQIPLPDGSVEEIMAIHLWEHFYRWECETVITEWKRLLQPGGRLVLELPDLLKACRNVLDGLVKGGKDPDQLTLWALYGDPRQCDPFMAHRWAWSPKSLRAFLTQHGFTDIRDEPTLFHPAGRECRDMRITARKA